MHLAFSWERTISHTKEGILLMGVSEKVPHNLRNWEHISLQQPALGILRVIRDSDIFSNLCHCSATKNMVWVFMNVW